MFIQNYHLKLIKVMLILVVLFNFQGTWFLSLRCSLKTAYSLYHIFSSLSSTFFNFFKNFSKDFDLFDFL